MSGGKNYIVHGMKAECSEGTMQNYINAGVGHGVVYQGNPLLNANDHVPEVNLTHFGDCNSKKIYEDAKKQADEKYKAELGDGFFEKAGKFIAKNVTKAVIQTKETFGVHKCELDTPLPWMFCNYDHMIDGAPALTEESQCPCRYGGIIKIVCTGDVLSDVVEEQKSENRDSETDVSIVPNDRDMKQLSMAKASKEAVNNKNEKMQPPTAGVSKAITNIINEVEKEKDDPIDELVNEKVFKKINPAWGNNIKTFKKNYGQNVFKKLRKFMRQYGITDRKSILMFIATIGTETWYGLYITEYCKDKKVTSKYYEYNTRGVGLVQITGSAQWDFLKYMRSKEPDGSKKAKELDRYINAFYKNGARTCCKLNAAEYIAEHYPIESAMWVWNANTQNISIQKDGKNHGTTLDKFIRKMDGNTDNVFLAIQYSINGKKLSDKDLEKMSRSKKRVVIEENEVKFNGEKAVCPIGWENRYNDWKNAKKFL